MRTPEEIAEQAAEYATELFANLRERDSTDTLDESGQGYWDDESLLIAATWAARKAVGLESYEGAGDANGPREPQFAPEGEPDEYRDGFERVKSGSADGNATMHILGGNGQVIVPLRMSEARHILAYLSESSHG